MNRQKIQKTTLAIILIITLLAIPILADPVFNQVTHTSPLQTGLSQTIFANITAINGTIASALLELNNINNSMTQINGRYEYTWTPSLGTTTYKIYATDENNFTAAYQSSFIVKDMILPVITIISPIGVQSSETLELKAITDENASCKYDVANKTYPLMSSMFMTTGTLVHSAILTHVPTGPKAYYIMCKDADDNIGSGLVTFNVNLGPSAQIKISKPSPLKADTYSVSVITSKPLAQTPTLQYKYDDEQKYYQISLIGQDSTWSGYLVILPDSKDRVGTFTFSGTDYDGLSGTKITSGQMFIVDTTKPIAPASIDSIDKDQNIELSWFYDGEDPDHFNIYRSTVSGVEYVDYYDDKKSSPYSESNIDDGITYYYRVAAVDKAGNIGDLSSETHITFIDTNKTQTEAPERLSETLEKILNQSYSQAKTLRFDIEYVISQLEKETDRFKNIVIKELKLIENANTDKASVDNILKELESLKSQDLSQKAFDERIKNIEARIDDIKSSVIKDVTITDSLEYTQRQSEGDVQTATNEIFLRQDSDEEIKSNYTSNAIRMQDSMNVFSTIIVSKLKSIDGDEEYITLFTKEVSTSDDALNVIILENIPKTIADSSKQIIFTQSPKILKDDPIVYWTYPKLESAKITYYLKEKRQISDAKDAKTLVMPDPAKYVSKKGIYSPEEQNPNMVTGNSILTSEKIKEFKEYIFIGLGLLVISGLLVYYFFFLDTSKENDNTQVKSIISAETSQESAKKDLPDLAAVEELMPRHDETKYLLSLIDHANIHAEKENHEQAIKEYSAIYDIFNTTTFGNISQKADMAGRITQLHKKIIDIGNGTKEEGDIVFLKKESNAPLKKTVLRSKKKIVLRNIKNIKKEKSTSKWKKSKKIVKGKKNG